MIPIKLNTDGACFPAQAILALIKEDIEINHHESHKVLYGRWENCREQGYVIVVRTKKRQRNIAFFEHRNSDELCAVVFDKRTTNTPTINDIPEDNPYVGNKYSVSLCFKYNEHHKMAHSIVELIEADLNDDE